MKIHRFYVPDIPLKQDFWLHSEALLHQWNKVLRFRPGAQAILFDGASTERLYDIIELSASEAHLQMRTELKRKLPSKHVYLFWSLLKRENNEHIIQKCTELGVTNFVPILSERTIKKDFNKARAHKIAIEASEQCGRSDIPSIREPIKLATAISEYKNKILLFVCDEKGSEVSGNEELGVQSIGVFIGPEGGWTKAENNLFKSEGIACLKIHELTLRAETAAVVVTSQLL